MQRCNHSLRPFFFMGGNKKIGQLVSFINTSFIMQQPLTHKQYQLQKFPGKGGWTFAEIPEVPMDKKAPFGWVCVKGRIDDYELNNYRLMPMGNGRLFLPVKAAIRKKLGKHAGDWVTIELYADDSKSELPPDLEDCLRDEPKALDQFLSLPEGAQKEFTDWIFSAKREETKVERMAKTIELLLQGATLRTGKTGRQKDRL